MRTSTLLALSLFTVGGCSMNRIGSSDEAVTVEGNIVISQIYGGSGSSGVVKNDYIELYNKSDSDVELTSGSTGYSVFYASATGVFSASTPIPIGTTIAAGDTFLINETAGGSGTSVPADLTGTINLSGTNGKVALAVTGTTPAVGGAMTADFVGYGSTASASEGGHPAPTLSSTTAAVRKGGGTQDTNDNAADFTATTPSPKKSSAVDDGGTTADAGPVDLATPPDMVVTTTGPFTALLNEVKLRPAPKPKEDGQEFIELVGSGTLPPHTFVVAISGDTGAKPASTAGLIEYIADVSAQPFGSNGLILVQSATATFAGAEAATNIIKDATLNTAKIGDYTETVVLVTVPNLTTTHLTVGAMYPASGVTLIDGIAVRAATPASGTPDPVFAGEGASLDACPNAGATTRVYPASAVSRIFGNTTALDATAWYAGKTALNAQAVDQGLTNVALCSTAATPPQTWVLTPGAPNDVMTNELPDFAQPILDFASAPADFATPPSGDDLSVDEPDLAVGAVDMAHKPSGSDAGSIKPVVTGNGGCSTTGGTATGAWTVAALLLGLASLRRRRRNA